MSRTFLSSGIGFFFFCVVVPCDIRPVLILKDELFFFVLVLEGIRYQFLEDSDEGMFGTQSTRGISGGFALRRRPYWMTSPTSGLQATSITSYIPNNFSVKFEDLYGFTVEVNIDDVNVLNEVRERMKEQGKIWWELEASKGANWYLQPQMSWNGEGISVSALKLSKLTNTITLKRLIRKGIPPVLRPKVWLSVSGAAKKRSTVPESYYGDLLKATEGIVTPATRQIDHVSS